MCHCQPPRLLSLRACYYMMIRCLLSRLRLFAAMLCHAMIIAASRYAADIMPYAMPHGCFRYAAAAFATLSAGAAYLCCLIRRATRFDA